MQGNGILEPRELVRMYRRLDLDELDCSSAVMDGFLTGEFTRVDSDGSGGLTLSEFTQCATSM